MSSAKWASSDQFDLLGARFDVFFSSSGQNNDDFVGRIRLYNGGRTDLNLSSGIVQVYLAESNADWVNICADGTNNNTMKKAADVVCHQLGYKEALSYSTAGEEK